MCLRRRSLRNCDVHHNRFFCLLLPVCSVLVGRDGRRSSSPSEVLLRHKLVENPSPSQKTYPFYASPVSYPPLTGLTPPLLGAPGVDLSDRVRCFRSCSFVLWWGVGPERSLSVFVVWRRSPASLVVWTGVNHRNRSSAPTGPSPLLSCEVSVTGRCATEWSGK